MQIVFFVQVCKYEISSNYGIVQFRNKWIVKVMGIL